MIEFSPQNPIVRLCLQGMALESQGQMTEALAVFLQAWEESQSDFEKYLAAYFVARLQPSATDKLRWLETALCHAAPIEDPAITSGYPGIYRTLVQCYDSMEMPDKAEEMRQIAQKHQTQPADPGPFYHGTKADLAVGDFLQPGGQSNFKEAFIMNHIYFTALPNIAGLAAGLANGSGEGRVFIIEPTGPFENDPNLTDQKFPGNATRSYRSLQPLKIVGELQDWVRQNPEDNQKWKEKLAKQNGEIIN